MLFLGTIASLYLGAISTFKDRFEFISDNLDYHEAACAVFAFLAIVAAAGHWFVERRARSASVKSEELFLAFFESVSWIVKSKTDRLRRAMITLRTSKKFDQLTSPHEQIEQIFQHASSFLGGIFSLKEAELDFTILEKRPGANWVFAFSHQGNWKHCAKSDTLDDFPTAKIAHDTGNWKLHSSKRNAEKDNLYRSSTRDQGKTDGSIFVLPTSVICNGQATEFVISIASYGRRFCDPWDDAGIQKTEALLRELCRRIELELHLLVAKRV